MTLTLLAEQTTVAGLFAALREATPERFHTQIGTSGETSTAFWHGDESYAAAPGPADARHRLIMAADGWRYVRSPITGDRP